MSIIDNNQNEQSINSLLDDQIAELNNQADEMLADQQQEINEMINLLED